ncbi:hypothetical protein QP028_12990 [Corynebacterium suedekumii]|nr:hypothetical protein QP028_12990 [Corynebacterium suedekumii]
MTAHGPFHSLSDTDKQALTDKLRSGASVLHAASELGLNYGHALQLCPHPRLRTPTPDRSSRHWPEP